MLCRSAVLCGRASAGTRLVTAVATASAASSTTATTASSSTTTTMRTATAATSNDSSNNNNAAASSSSSSSPLPSPSSLTYGTVPPSGNATAVLSPSTQGPIPGLLSPLPSPYPTEGGHVPIYSLAHGVIHKRYWLCRNPQWCELCKEPVAQWLNHMGRKDHSLLDMHYNVMAEWPRRWSPERVLRGLLDELGCPMTACHRPYAHYDREHRNMVYAMLVKLEEAGMVYFGDARHTYLHRMQGGLRGMDLQGALVLHELLLGPFLRLYPDAQIQNLSNLVDFVTCAYNLETVYDLCGFYTLDKIALKSQYTASSPAALGLGGLATGAGVTTGYSSNYNSSSSSSSSASRLPGALAMEEGGGAAAADEDDKGGGGLTPRPRSRAAALAMQVRARQQEDLDEEVFSRKATFMRQLLGQLRWLLTPQQEHPAGYTFAPHMMVLGENCLKALVVELIVARVCEYMLRAEPVWRTFGYERKRLDMRRVVRTADDVVPTPVRDSFRPLSPRHDDLFTDKGDALDEDVRAQLRQKGLPIPPSFAPRAGRRGSEGGRVATVNNSSNSSNSSSNASDKSGSAVNGGGGGSSKRASKHSTTPLRT